MKKQLYMAAIRADDLYAAELKRVFGDRAGSMRYTKAGKGEEGSVLRKLYQAWQNANDTWFNAEPI